jgi:arginine/lysine/ornithine decarboxylase
MPGHKGHGPLGCESLDLTEIAGADALYEASGIIAASEKNAAALFGTAATLYSTEGSSQCIRAMLALALGHWQSRNRGKRPVILAARNAHKAFLLAAALLDFDVRWLWPETEDFTLCRCPVTAGQVRRRIAAMDTPPAAVYVTSPDYLGGMLDVAALAEAAHAFGVPLLADNAHGAYLRFLPGALHPMELGADLCCDSAHKTLPVLTGGAYLHIGHTAPADFRENARGALALFGSTSPSYLILQSLDAANRTLAGGSWQAEALVSCRERMDRLRQSIRAGGWQVTDSDPWKLTVEAANSGWTGPALADALRRRGVEYEYADPDFVVLMITPSNPEGDFSRLESIFSDLKPRPPLARPALRLAQPTVACSVREAVFAPRETVPAAASVGRVLAAPTVSCPPAVPVAVSGEVIGPDAAAIFRYYGMETVDVLKRR